MSQMWNEILEQPVTLKRCMDMNYSKISEFVAKIKDMDIDLICIAARGTSDHAGVFGKYIFEIKNGIPVSLSAPSVNTVYGKALKLKNSLVIGISQSGKAEDVLEVVRHAKEQNCITVGITNDADSIIAKEAMYHFSCEAGLEKSIAATKTFLAQMLIISMIAALWANDTVFMERLLQLPEMVGETLKMSEDIKVKAERYRYMNECFVLARGINYPIALETALKVQETSYVRARGYAISDFYHGPLAMIEKDMPVIVFSPKGPTLEYSKEMIERLKSVGAELIVISNEDEAIKAGSTSFRIPETEDDAISAFLNIVVAQQFSCHLAEIKGTNPDSPRSLKKVTITR
ncbi:MAG: SIS domain-containing protein [Clostridia bacterium]